jgi:hypothetical protein
MCVLLIVPGPSMSSASPLGPTWAEEPTVAITWLSLTVLLRNTSFESPSGLPPGARPASKANGSPR